MLKNPRFLAPQKSTISVEKHKDVEVFKGFGLMPVKEAKEGMLFLDDSGKEIRIINITKENYNGQIYDVDVPNDIVLVRRGNLTTWSGNSNSNDLQFLSLKCGETVLNYTFVNDSVFIPEYNCSSNSFETSKVLTSGVHTLEFRFGDDTAYAYNDATVAQITSTNLTQGLVGKWSCEGNFKDSSGQANHGTQSGGVKIERGVKGRSCGFDGGNDLVNTTLDNTEFPTSSFSVAMWAKPSTQSAYQTAVSIDSATSNDESLFSLGLGNNGNWTFRLHTDVGKYQAATIIPPLVNGWTHVVGTYNSTLNNVSIYVNGVLINYTISAGTRRAAEDSLLIGTNTYQDVVSNWFGGSVDEVRIYNRSLSATEISTLYNTTKTYKIVMKTTPTQGILNESGLVGYWKMNREDGSNSTRAIDSSGVGVTGTVSGATFTNEGKFKEGYKFDGVNDNINIGTLNYNTSHFTVSAWVKDWDLSSGGWSSIFHSQWNSWNYDMMLIVLHTNGQMYISNDYGIAFYATAGSRSGWHHMTLVYNDSDVTKFYWDGKMTGSDTSFNAITVTSNVAILGGASGGSYPFNGTIDEVRIYNRSLSISEVAALYNGTKSNKISIKTTPVLGGLNDTPAPTSSNEVGLVGYWKMDDLVNGNTTDSSGQNNNGSVIGATFNSGRWNNGYSFDGTTDYVTVNHSNSLNITRNLTISLWFKPNSTAGNHLIKKDNNGPNQRKWYLDAVNSNIIWTIFNDSSGCNLNCLMTTVVAGTYYANIWNHVVATYECPSTTGTMQIFVNGVLSGSTASAKCPIEGSGTFPIDIGGGGWYWFNGSIDEVRIYNRSLSADEVKELYLSKGLVGYWKMNADQKNSTSTFDTSGYYNHGLITGATLTNEGRFKEGYLMNAGTNVVTVTSNPSLNFTNTTPFSISAWIKNADITSSTNYLGKTNGGVIGYYMGRYLNDIYLQLDATYCLGNTDALGNANWHFITGVFNTTHCLCYTDGVFLNSAACPVLTTTTNNLQLGRGPSVSMNGTIDEVRIYNRALTSTEVGGLYNGTKSNKITLKDIPA